jgi:hypothetical protein
MRRKTEIRIAKSGRKYWYNPNAYQLEKERIAKRLGEQQTPLITYDGAKTTVYRADKTNAAYGRYYEKKLQIRSEYPIWRKMKREDWREYMSRILNLIHNDEDYKQYKEETKTIADRLLDARWEELKRKEENYDGRNDEYEY